MSFVICVAVEESGTRHLSLVPAGRQPADQADETGASGLADVFTLQRHRAASADPWDEHAYFVDTLAEYQ
ncbi:hypothetical protein ACH427_28095 [Streptomyces sp. NPDC020379]|uniref:hypothetical protein n=1 Tax=Streptomyces sp. NPDC020379 TaxID=3365071 RepID=UPI0037A3A4E1